MAINLAHETAHTFGMGDKYDRTKHTDVAGFNCVMESYGGCDAMEGQEAQKANSYYYAILNNEADAFCDDCAEDLRAYMHKMMDGNGGVFNYEEE